MTETETKKTPLSRLACALLALVMAIGICVPTAAFAADPGTYTITVNNAAENEEYNAYKIFDVTYDGNGAYSYTIDSGSIWYETVVAAKDVFTLTQVGGSSTYVVTVNEGATDEEIVAVFTDAGVPEGANADATAKGTKDASTEEVTAVLDVSGSGAGYYFVTTTLGSLVIIDTTNPTVTINEKNGIPGLDKSANHVTDDNGEMIEYYIDITDITGVLNLKLHDYMDNDLRLQTDDEGNYKVTVTLYPSKEAEKAGTGGTVLIYGTDYTVTLTGEGKCTQSSETNCTFEVDFTDYDFSNCTEDYVLHVVYDCDVNTESEDYEGDEVDLSNLAHLTYGTYSSTTDVDWDVYLFGFEIHKFTEDENTYLAGAQFEITGDDGRTAYFLYEEDKGIYLFEGWLEDGGTVPESYTTTLTSTDSANIKIEGLDEGTYTVTETAAPDGYNKLTSPLIVTITYTGTEENPGTFTVTYNGSALEDNTLYVENNAGQVLPGTGGMGTTIFYIIGGILVVGAVVVLITRRRMSNRA